MLIYKLIFLYTFVNLSHWNLMEFLDYVININYIKLNNRKISKLNTIIYILL